MSTVSEPTPWGYSIMHEDDETWTGIPPLVSRADFNTATGGRFTDTAQVDAVLASVSQAVRDFCGWHIAPNLPCLFTAYGLEGKIAKLPSLMVTDCVLVESDGEQHAVEWQPRGLVKAKGWWDPSWGQYSFAFDSGYEGNAGIAQIVTQIASNNLAAVPGIREEQAGAVRLSYNQTGNGISGGMVLLEREQMMLSPYRLQSGVV